MAKISSTKYKSNKQEKRIAKEIGGKTVVGSGCLWFAKADVRLDTLLIECKTTEKSYYSLTLSTWNKACKEALNDGMRVPVMIIDLEDGERSYAVMNKSDLSILNTNGYSMNVLDKISIDTKSFRIKSEVDLRSWELAKNESIKYNVLEVLFAKTSQELVILDWTDFIMFAVDKREEIYSGT